MCEKLNPKTEQEKDWLDEHHEKKVNELIGKPTDASWEERLEDLPAINYNLYFGRAEAYPSDDCLPEQAALDQIKAFIRKVREEGKKEGYLEAQHDSQGERAMGIIEGRSSLGHLYTEERVQMEIEEGIRTGRRRAVEYIKKHGNWGLSDEQLRELLEAASREEKI